MAKRLYVKGNYIIADNDGVFSEYPTSRSVYTTTSTAYLVKEQIDNGTLVILYDEIGDWLDAEIGGDPFTDETLKIFLQNNTANFNKGGATKFAELTDVPPYLNNSLKWLRVNATETGIEAYTATDLNQWLMPNVAFVDPVNGDDDNAIVGDGNLPFRTIASAQIASTKIILLPANYSGNVFVTQDGIEMFAMKGVKFISGGVRVIGTGVNKFDFKGYAVFEGLTAEGLRVQNSNAVVNFDCDYMDNSLVCWTEGDTFAPKINFNCNWIRCSSFNGAGYGVRLVGGSEILMSIKHYYVAQHANFHARNNTTGKLIVNCPNIAVIDNYTSNYGNLAKRAMWLDSLNGAFIEINGNLINTFSTYIFNACCFSMENFTQLTESKIVINGDLISLNNFCIFSQYRSANGNIQINGNLISGRNAIYDEITGWAGATDQKWIFNGSIIDSQYQLLITRGKKYFFKNISIHINEDGTGIAGTGNIFKTADPTAPVADAFLYLYNCQMQTNEIAGETFNSFNAQFHVATINTQSNVAIGSGVVDDWTGFAVNANLITPKIS